MVASPLKTGSVIGAVVEALTQSILGNEFQPGEKIAEVSFAARYGVPRPTVRSALVILQEQGLLRREPNRSVYVPRFDASDIQDIFAMRLLIETEAVRRLVRHRTVPAEAMTALRILDGLQLASDWALFVEYDFTFHRRLVEGAGSDRLVRLYRGISAETQLAISQLRPYYYEGATGLAGEHARIVATIQSGDESAAVAAIDDHIREAEQILLDNLAAEGV